MSRVFVTGAGGFVGQALVPVLKREGHQVTALVRRSPFVPLAGVRYVLSDNLAQIDPIHCLRGHDVVIHLVARTHSADIGDPSARELYEHINVRLTADLARAAAAQGVGRFVFLSTVKVLGERTNGRAFRESNEPAPEDLYGVTKLEAERLLAQIAGSSGMGLVVLRPPLVHGPGVKGNFLRLLRLIDRGVPMPLASIRNARSLVGLENLCDAINRCVEHPAAQNRTFLVSDGEDLSTPTLLKVMADALGRPARLVPFAVRLLGIAARLSGRSSEFERLAGSLQVDSSEICAVLGWQPPTPVAVQMRATANWFRSGIGS